MEELNPYFSTILNKDVVNLIKFYEENNKFVFKYKNEKIIVKDIDSLTKLVFGTWDENESLNIITYNAKELVKFINNCFPIPFVWAYNLNYC